MNSPGESEMRKRRGRELIARQMVKPSKLRPNASPALARASKTAGRLRQRADAAQRVDDFDLAVFIADIAAALAQPDETADKATRERHQYMRSVVAAAREEARLRASISHAVVHGIGDLAGRIERLERLVAEMIGRSRHE
jgi:hypothetical protein